MVVTDPIADFLTRIRNANMVLTDKVEIPASKTKMAMAEILKDEGFINDVEYIEDGKQGVIRVYLKYGAGRERIINGLKRISKPGLRVYVGKEELPRVMGGLGIAIISTSRGLMVDRKARKEGLGGEVLCYVW
ncbi:MAG TPA: 30S ribosomal protein S8 [Candidatus Avidehalobacter gallistercoris]|uniref:Small ribosomal subunit protein uS8 n=1 Tax=Candidatus Avidehalobacter gallistercoris TaxID=2840694 RepID=A0A9D1HJ43_9FIRM|nr:30S ribosomal protein S8 [Candidatus Avidehalobacter gallistercoris]